MQGVARTLLAAACEGLRAQGLRAVEAYPRPDAPSAAEHHSSPLPLDLSSGFVVHQTEPDGSVIGRNSP